MDILWSDDPQLDAQQRGLVARLARQSSSEPFGDIEVWDAWSATLPADRRVRVGLAAVGHDAVGMLALSAQAPNAGADDPTDWHLWGETVDFGVVWAQAQDAAACWDGWFEGLRERGTRRIRLRNVRMSDPAISAMVRSAERSNVRLELLDRRLAPYVDLSAGFDSWLTTRSKSQRRQYRRALRAFSSVPDRDLRLLSEPDMVEHALNTFFELHRARRATLDLSSVYDDGQAADFLRAVAKPWAEQGRLIAMLATSNSVPVGIELIIVTDSMWYSLNGGWNHDFATYHVGTGMLLEAMQAASAAGARRYSLLEGEEPYKMRMASGGHQLASWDLHINEAS